MLPFWTVPKRVPYRDLFPNGDAHAQHTPWGNTRKVYFVISNKSYRWMTGIDDADICRHPGNLVARCRRFSPVRRPCVGSLCRFRVWR